MGFSGKIDFEQSEVFFEDWEEVVFSEVIEINPKRDLKKGETAKSVSMADLEPFQRKVGNFITREFKGGSKFKNGDTLLARITPCLENGKTAFVDILDDEEIGFGSTEFIVLSAKRNKADPLYVYYLARSPEVRKTTIKSMTGTSGRQRVENAVFDNIVISLPSLPEQTAISGILSDLDSKIELNQQMNKTLEAMGQAIFKRWFVDFEFPNEEGTPYKSSGGEMVYDKELDKVIPAVWTVGCLGDIANNVRNPVKPETVKSVTPYIGLEHMPRKSIALSDWGHAEDVSSNKSLFHRRDVLFGKLRPYFHKVGVAPIDGFCSTDILVIAAKQPESFGMVLFHLASDELVKYADMTSTGTKMPRANWNDLAQFKILIPPLEIMKDFTNLINPIVERIIKNVVHSRTLESVLNSLLPKLMSGKIRVLVTKENVEVQ